MIRAQIICLVLCCISLTYGLKHNTPSSFPNISIKDFEKALNNDNMDALHKIKDEGGKIGAIAISGLGHDYKTALEDLILKGPECMDSLSADKVNVNQMPDSSYRKTYATMDGQFPNCFNLRTLSNTFDNVDSMVSKMISRKMQKDSSVNTSPISYNLDGKTVSLDNAPIKEHIHVYDRSGSTSTHIVPFHVDNGVYLIITPFPGHGLKLKLSNNKIVSSEGLEDDSVIVLFGRGLTEWLLQNQIPEQEYFHAVPHAVPTVPEKSTSPRTVYARMKVAHSSAIPHVKQHENHVLPLKTFDDVFMETGYTNHNDLCNLGRKWTEKTSISNKERDIWLTNMGDDCEDGKAFCWMSCMPLPDECPDVEDAICYNEVNDQCYDDSMDPTCAWHCKQ